MKFEFENLVGVQISDSEFDALNTIYLSSDDSVSKQDLAKWWVRTHSSYISRYKAVKKAREEKIKRYELACECDATISVDDVYVAKRFKSSTRRLLDKLGIPYEGRTLQSVWVALRSMQCDLKNELGI